MANMSQQSDAALPAPTPSAAHLLRSWFDRRMLQVTGVYLAGAWPFFQFVQWLVNRYVLSPHLVDACLLLLLILLPSILLVAHASEKHGGWTRLQKIGIPCNLVGAVILLLVLFGGKDMGSAQKTVTVTDDDGTAVERVIPKSEFRKHVAVFFFDNASGEADLDWLRSGIPEALYADQSQDLFMTVKPQGYFTERIQQAGFASGFGVPLALQQQIAKEHQADHVLNGTIHAAEDGYRLETRLYRAANGKLIETRTFEGADPLALVDRIGVQMKRDLEIPSHHIENTTDLPAAEVLTRSLEAFRKYVEGDYARTFGQDPETAEALFEEAVTLDPTFAFAHLQRAQLYMNQHRMQEGLEAYQTVQQYSYRVPERIRYAVNCAVFFLNRQPEETLQAVRQWITLFPDDTEGYDFLAKILGWRGETDKAIAARRQVLELDPNQPDQLLRIGDLLRDAARYDEARQAYADYVERVPDSPRGYARLGRALGALGDLDGKLAAYRQALVHAPDDPEIITALAAVQLQRGAFDEADDLYRRALNSSRTPRERYDAQVALAWYLEVRGQQQALLEQLRASWETQAEYDTPTDIARTRAMRAHQFAEAGAAQEAEAFIAEARANPAAADGFFAVNLDIWEAFTLCHLGRPGEALPLLDEARADVETYGMDVGTWLEQSRGLAYEKLERWAEAEAAYVAYLDERPSSAYGWTRLGTVRLARDNAQGAIDAFREALRFYPSYPEAHLRLAQTFTKQGKPDAARTHLDQALAAWAEADADYDLAAEARALLASIS